jgi:hypothetical protein
MLKPLMELGEDKDEAIEYVHQILEPAWTYHDASNEALKNLYEAIEDTADKIDNEEPAKGKAHIEESLTHGAEIVQRIKDWLGWGNLTPEQREQAEQRKRVKRAQDAWPVCKELARNPDILGYVSDTLNSAGLVGQ